MTPYSFESILALYHHNQKDSDIFIQLFHDWWLIAARGVIAIVFGILAAIEFWQVLPREWTMIIGGMLSVLLGTWLFVFPA